MFNGIILSELLKSSGHHTLWTHAGSLRAVSCHINIYILQIRVCVSGDITAMLLVLFIVLCVSSVFLTVKVGVRVES